MECYRAKIGSFASRVCRKISRNLTFDNRRIIDDIREESVIFWNTVLIMSMLLVTVCSIACLGLATVTLANGDSNLSCPGHRNGATVTEPIPESVLKTLLLISGVESNPGPTQDGFYDPEEELTIGSKFDSQEKVRADVKLFCDRTFVPLIIAASSAENPAGRDRGRMRYKCTHGHKRKKTANKDRPRQSYNFTACTSFVNINENKDGVWVVTKLCLEHQGHVLSQENYFSYPHVRKLTEDDLDYVKVSSIILFSVQHIMDVYCSKP